MVAAGIVTEYGIVRELCFMSLKKTIKNKTYQGKQDGFPWYVLFLLFSAVTEKVCYKLLCRTTASAGMSNFPAKGLNTKLFIAETDVFFF